MALNINPIISECTCYAVCGREIVVRSDDEKLTFDDLLNIKKACGSLSFLEEKDNDLCVLAISDKEKLPSEYKLVSMRSVFFVSDTENVYRISRAKALASWLADTKFCAKCGAPLVARESESALECKECGSIVYPRINPCIIVLVHKGDKILLARHAQRNQDIYACLAGFIECGESAEHAVEREIMEETGLKVKNIKYFGSQSWPFPSQLMFGFTAEWESGEISKQDDEIADAQWFSPDDCPATPSPGSIAYLLIEDAKKKQKSV